MTGQKAPSTKRCIKTNNCLSCQGTFSFCQKAPRTKRRIKTCLAEFFTQLSVDSSESTERQKVAQSVVEVSQKAPSTPKSRMQFP